MLDDFNIEAIHKEVHARRSIPHLTDCLVFLKVRIYFKVDVLLYGRYNVLREMGFRHKKYQNKQYIEQLRVCHDYLCYLRRNRSPAESQPVVYLDETWVNAHYGRDTMQVDADGVANDAVSPPPDGVGWDPAYGAKNTAKSLIFKKTV